MSKTQKLTKISILSAAAYLIMFLQFPLPIFPNFLKVDFSDVPALFAAFAFGGVYGVIVEAIKNLLHLFTQGNTMGIGEFANFLVGSAMVFTAGYVYQKNKTQKNLIVALTLGVIAMIVVASLGNYFIFLPLYEKILGFPINAVVGMTSKINKAVVDLNTLIIYSIMPFNLVKGTLASLVAYILYSKLKNIL